jgi:predicted NUDIX family phosphoesterase
MQKISAPHTHPHITPEDILVIKRSDLFAHVPEFQGLQSEPLAGILKIISQKKEFLPRPIMETDPTYKQIIPYLIFNHENKYFLMQRQAKASEQRLKNKYTLGIGGHIRLQDMKTDEISDWAQREFHEEVHYSGHLAFSHLGILNDDSNDVGKVHVGVVLLLKGDHENISVKSELKSGRMLTLEEMQPYAEHMESWSQTVYHYLCAQTSR